MHSEFHAKLKRLINVPTEIINMKKAVKRIQY